MKKFIAAFAIAAVALSAQAQVSKTLVKTFPLNGAKAVTIDIKNAQVDIKTSDEEVMRIQTTVTLKNGNETVFEQLSKSGRYNLALSADAKPMLTAADRATTKVSGADLEEEVKYVVTVPKYVDAQNVNAIAFGGKKGKGKAKPKAAPVKKAPAKKAAK
jgi:hypothetical protein